MILVHSKDAQAVEVSAKVARLLGTVRERDLREWVGRISVPRHFAAEPEENRAVAAWLQGMFESFGFIVQRQGELSNLIACPKNLAKEAILVGAHYDSVTMCPGADDNGSAVAAMLGCAAACSLWEPAPPIVFVAFNCEEDGLAGSRDFVANYLPTAPFRVKCAHVLEMVGYCSSEPGSQRVPPGLPIKLRDVGDFLGLLANGNSTASMNAAIERARAYVRELPVTGLSVKLGLEKFLPVLARSDHAPFWAASIPAVMWTDTSEFRNPNYHQRSDTPETLDYAFLRKVTQALVATMIHEARELSDE